MYFTPIGFLVTRLVLSYFKGSHLTGFRTYVHVICTHVRNLINMLKLISYKDTMVWYMYGISLGHSTLVSNVQALPY